MSDKLKQLSTSKKRFLLCAGAFLLTLAAMYAMYIVMKVPPFGNRSIAWEDADIQYLDFFSYFRDVLIGKNRIAYSMTNTLGNGGIGLYSYYLASPFNLLVVLFKQSQLEVFFSLIVALKVAAASATACYFLQVRFADRIDAVITVLLACGYGMMQYDLAQCSNVMWLDGVYMLPLMLLGVYKVVEKKQIHPLAIATALSILFNWYTGGINCLFSIFYVVIEYALYMCREKVSVKQVFQAIIRYGIAMLLGVCMSAVLFLPTVFDLRKGKGSSFNLEMLRNSFSGNPLFVIRDYTIGGISTPTEASLFAGSLILIGCLAVYFNHNYKWSEKIVLGIGMICSLVVFFYAPTHLLFSLLKNASSYWFRYSYVSIFYLLFVAGNAYAKPDKKLRYWIIVLPYLAVYLILSIVRPRYTWIQVGLTAAFVIVIAVGLQLGIQKAPSGKKRIALLALLTVCAIAELDANACYLSSTYCLKKADAYRSYVTETDKQLGVLRAYDQGQYRISQTSRRSNVAHLDESLGYNYWGNTGYTSSPDNQQLQLLNRLGYKMHGECLNVVAGSVLSADSLLGVKYVISEQTYPGLLPIQELPEANGKQVYENPYCLPLASRYIPKDETYTNPFEYQNLLYSELCGEQVEIYTRLNVTSHTEGNKRIYDIQIPDGNYAVYGNIETDRYVKGRVGRVGSDGNGYSDWLSMGVFYIAHEPEESEISVYFSYPEALTIWDEQFYALNLDALHMATQKITEKQPEQLDIKNGKVSCTVTARAGESLYLSVPYGAGWTVTRNGVPVEADMFAECMTSIPLEEGENVIVMTYRIPHMRKAILISLFGVCCLVGILILQKKRKLEF